MTSSLLLFLASALQATAPATPAQPGKEALAKLPRTYINTNAPAAPAKGGQEITVGHNDNLQAALDRAQPGDVITLATGTTFTGNFILRNKRTTSTKWITIRPQEWSRLPAAGVRMTPDIAAADSLPRILNASSAGVITTEAGAHHYRITGVEISITDGSPPNTGGLVQFGASSSIQRTPGDVPHHLVLDRLYIHGSASATVRRCVALNAATAAVIDSWLSDCHELGADSQAIMGWNGPGPFKIVNNYLEGAGENVMFGGGDPGIPNLTPSDIEIRHNHFFKPTSWKGKWSVKNLLEFKNAQRVFIEGNVFESTWQDGQVGFAIIMKSSNQDKTAPWSVAQDITVRNNLIRNVGAGISLAGSPDAQGGPTNTDGRRFTIVNNLITGINTGAYPGQGDGVLIIGDVTDAVVAHNTIIQPTRAAVYFALQGRAPSGPTVRTTLRDNVFVGGAYGVKGDGRNADAAFASFAPDGVFARNVFVLPSSGYGAANAFVASVDSIHFMNITSGDYRLAKTSAFKGHAGDGRDPGANIATVMSLTASAVVTAAPHAAQASQN
ncbi:MAG: right-handed parallel beta-helix repeat-containing protein [bacterium]